jgi:hypothetical protein
MPGSAGARLRTLSLEAKGIVCQIFSLGTGQDSASVKTQLHGQDSASRLSFKTQLQDSASWSRLSFMVKTQLHGNFKYSMKNHRPVEGFLWPLEEKVWSFPAFDSSHSQGPKEGRGRGGEGEREGMDGWMHGGREGGREAGRCCLGTLIILPPKWEQIMATIAGWYGPRWLWWHVHDQDTVLSQKEKREGAMRAELTIGGLSEPVHPHPSPTPSWTCFPSSSPNPC